MVAQSLLRVLVRLKIDGYRNQYSDDNGRKKYKNLPEPGSNPRMCDISEINSVHNN